MWKGDFDAVVRDYSMQWMDESREGDIAIIVKLYEPAVNPSSVGDEVSGCPAPQNRVSESLTG